MQVATPLYMKANTAELLGKKVKGRQAFKKFMDSTRIFSDVVTDIVTNQIRLTDDNSIISWVGGSQAWFRWQQEEQVALQSTLEESAFTAGNSDIFYVCNSLETCEKFIEQLENFVIPYIKQQCEERLALVDENYKITIVRSGFDEAKKHAQYFNVNEPVVYTLFPGYNVMFLLDVPLNKGYNLRGKEGNMDIDGEFDGKLALYLDISFAEGVNLPRFKSQYLVQRGAMWYPNDVGLLTFGMLIPTSRTGEKGLDVDTLRKDVLLRTVQSRTGLSAPAILNEMTARYQSMFYGTSV